MFQKSTVQEDMFKSAAPMMDKRAQKRYEDRNAWHNRFREQITNKIDEELFRGLFSEENGAPNAPIRILVGMMILKEGRGISDENLFEDARFNMLTRSALGLLNMDDYPPVESTYYLLRQRIVEYEQGTGINLMERAFKGLTKEQAVTFEVSGKHVRMDSKLLGSNIAWYSRYGIVHETIGLFYRANEEAIGGKLKEKEIGQIKELLGESGSAVTYRSTKAEVEKKFEEIGALAYVLVKSFKGLEGQREYGILKRVFEEQYKIEQSEGGKKTVAAPKDKGETIISTWADNENRETVAPQSEENNAGAVAEQNEKEAAGQTVVAKEKEEVSAQSVQNPHDPDCHYRTKSGSAVKGYSVNVTETCDKDKLNLIVDVQTEPASAADNDYVQEALAEAAAVVPEKIESAHTDGAYHSPENQTYCQEKDIDLITGGIQGKPSKYDLELDGQNDLIVTNKETGAALPAVVAKPKDPDAPKRWRVQDGDHAPIYFTEQDVGTCRLRKKMEALQKEVRNIRNNVEATIFQLGYHYRSGKSRYRGLAKHRLWAISRCFWINFRRIAAWMGGTGDEVAGAVLSLCRFFLKAYPTSA
jgi:hypothetical protein